MTFGKTGLTVLSLAVLASFLMPWVSLSCGGVELASVSPVDVIMDADLEAPDEFREFGGNAGSASELVDESPDGYADVPMYVAIAGIAALVGLAARFLPVIARIVVPAIGVGSLALFYIRLGMMESEMLKAMRAEMSNSPRDEFWGDSLNVMGQAMVNAVDLSVAIGFWVAFLAFAAAVGLGTYVKVKREDEG